MTEPAPPNPDRVDLEALLADRFSCRGFLGTPVPESTITRMFELAQRTASWCNTQPWQVTVTSGPATAELAAALTTAVPDGMTPDLELPAGYSGVYDQRRKESGFALYASLGIERTDRAARAEQALANFTFFGAPHTAVITTDREQGVYGAIDCGGYVSTLLLAARSLGVDTVAQAAIAMYSGAVREHLRLGADRQVVCAVSFGYADPEHPANAFRTSRAPLTEVLDRRG